jgi:hypothetical protein
VAVLAAAIGSLLGQRRRGPGAAGKRVSEACPVVRVVTASSYQPALDAVADDLASGDECVYLDVTVADGSYAARVVDEERAHVDHR